MPRIQPSTAAGLCVTRSKGLPPLEAKCCRKTSQSRLSRLRHTSTGKSFWKDRRRLKRDWEVLRQHFASRGGKPLLLVTHSPARVLGSHTRTMYPVVHHDGLLFTNRDTRHTTHNGSLRFRHWNLYGDRRKPTVPVTD